MEKKAILVVSFGTSHLDTLEKTIQVIEEQIQGMFPEYKVYRAFTSQMILNKLRNEMGIHYFNVSEAMEQIAEDGVETVIVQPTHIIPGSENEKMQRDLERYKDKFKKLCVGKPMLSCTEDYKKAIHAIVDDIHMEEDERLILMGHGSEHHANAAYPALEYTFHSLGYHHVYVGTVEGFPELKDVMNKLESDGAKKAVLIPFMFVAGDHAKNDMAGEEDSWKTELEEAGYEVRSIIKGLGEMQGIRKIFLEHLEELF